jgi:hypothetical protein
MPTVFSLGVVEALMVSTQTSPGSPVSSTNKTGRHDITEILLKMVLKHNQTNGAFDWK